MEHTPRLNIAGNGMELRDTKGLLICETPAGLQPHMPEIVKRYNAHDELVALIKELDKHFETLDKHQIHIWPNHPLNPRKRIADTLAKAEGK